MKTKINILVLSLCIAFHAFSNANSSQIYSVTTSDADATCTLTLNPTPSQTICIGTSLNLCPNEAGGTPGYTYLWSDGSLTQCINVSPATTAVYAVTVTDAAACTVTSLPILITVFPPLTVVALVNDSSICTGEQVSLSAAGVSGGDGNYTYTWIPNLPNSPGPFSLTPSITTTYTVIVTDGCGTPAASASATVTVNPTPVAMFNGMNLSGCVPLISCFTDLSIVASGFITQWQWDFGDLSAPSTFQNPCHTYTVPSSPNKYSVTLTVTTNAGCSQSFMIMNYVDAHPITVASFSFITNGLTVSFYDSSVGGASLNWSFGDGYYGNGQNPVHTYDSAGQYEVCLYSNNIYNCSDTICDSVNVIDIGIGENNFAGTINIFPNPATGELRITSAEFRMESIDIYDAVGEKILHRALQKENNALLDVRSLPAGIYFVQVRNNSRIFNQKIIIQK